MVHVHTYSCCKYVRDHRAASRAHHICIWSAKAQGGLLFFSDGAHRLALGCPREAATPVVMF